MIFRRCSQHHATPRARYAAGLILPLILAGCGMPKDPSGTTNRIIASHILRAGASENPPWVRFRGDRPEGIEPALVEDFARSLGARVLWVRNGESTLLEALEKRELDIVAGGITAKTPWRARLGTTRPYLVTRRIVAARSPAAVPDRLAGWAVETKPGEAAAARLRSKGAIPVADGSHAQLRTIDDWQAEMTGLTPTHVKLGKDKHVLLAAPGENQLLLRLDRYLGSSKALIARTLRTEASDE